MDEVFNGNSFLKGNLGSRDYTIRTPRSEQLYRSFGSKTLTELENSMNVYLKHPLTSELPKQKARFKKHELIGKYVSGYSKQMCKRKGGVDCKKHIFTLNGKVLNKDETVENQGIKNGNIIRVQYR